MWKKLSVCLFLVLMLCGCSKYELEDKEFPTVLGFWLENGKRFVSYDEYGNQAEWNSQEELEEAFQDQTDKFFDMAHVKVILLGEELAQDKAQMGLILEYLEKNPIYAGSIYVAVASDMEQVFRAPATGNDLGTYIPNMYQNNPYLDEKEAVLLNDLFNHWHNEEPQLSIPILIWDKNVPVIKEYANFSALEWNSSSKKRKSSQYQ